VGRKPAHLTHLDTVRPPQPGRRRAGDFNRPDSRSRRQVHEGCGCIRPVLRATRASAGPASPSSGTFHIADYGLFYANIRQNVAGAGSRVGQISSGGLRLPL
jgi:hypothetical protein